MDDQHRKEAGIAGETAALNYLREQGLKLIARNYRCRAGEIDLIMLDGPTLALIEVRYRTDDAFGGAAASVTWRKQRRIITAARHLILTRAELRRYPARFDVVALAPGPRGPDHDLGPGLLGPGLLGPGLLGPGPCHDLRDDLQRDLHHNLRHNLRIEWIKAAFTT